MRYGHQVKTVFVSEVQHCQVLGPFNSGTTLMHVYLRKLFLNYQPGLFPFWKHSLPPIFYPYPRELPFKPVPEPPEKFPGVLFLCMIRSPYFWINSTYRHPYELLFEKPVIDISRRLRTPLVLSGHERFKNIVQVWNNYYQRYMTNLESNNRVIYVRLEDLVRKPLDTLCKLETMLNRKPDSEFQKAIEENQNTPMKEKNAYGQTWEDENQLAYLLKSVGRSDLAFINAQLNLELMKKFDYPQVWIPPSID